MKRLLAILLLLLLSIPTRLPAAQLYVSLVDLGLTAVTNRTVLITGNSLPRGSSSGVVLMDKRRVEMGTNSYFWVSNAVEGVYLISVLAQPFATIPTSQTDFRVLVTNTTAVLGANTNLVAAAGNTYPSDTVSWGAAASDGRYLLRGEYTAAALGLVTNEFTTNASGTFNITNAALWGDAEFIQVPFLTFDEDNATAGGNWAFLNPIYGTFIGGGGDVTNIPITALQGSGGSGTAATNGTAGQSLLSAANGGVYWGAAGGAQTNIPVASVTNAGTMAYTNATDFVPYIVSASQAAATNADLLTYGAVALPRQFHHSTNMFASLTPGSYTQSGAENQEFGHYATFSTNVTVSAMARWMVSGNAQVHTLKIRDALTSNTIASVTLTASGTTNTWQTVELTRPVELVANRRYVFLSTENLSGDEFPNAYTNHVMQSHVSERQAVYRDFWEDFVTIDDYSNQVFGVSAIYAPGPNFIPWTHETESNRTYSTTRLLSVSNIDGQNYYGGLIGGSNYISPDIGTLFREPPQLGLTTWLLAGVDADWQVWTNAAAATLTNGLYNAGVRWLELNDGSAATNYPYNVNRVIAGHPDLHPLGWSWFNEWAHTNGFKTMAYLAWMPIGHSNTIGNRSSLDQIYNDVLTIKSNGFDGLTIDTSLAGLPTVPNREDLVKYVRRIRQADNDWRGSFGPGTNRLLYLSVGLNMVPTTDTENMNYTVFPLEFADTVNSYLWNSGMTNVDFGAYAANARRNFHYGWVSRPSHNVNFAGLRYTQFSSNVWRKILILRSAFAGGNAFVSDLSTDAAAFGYQTVLTNREFMDLYMDPAMLVGRSVYSNSLNEIWLRPIGSSVGPTNLVYFLNGSDGSSTNLVLTAGMLNVSSNQLMLVRDPLAGTNVSTFTGTFTRTVTVTNVEVFAVSPLLDYTGGTFTGDGNGLTNLALIRSVGAAPNVQIFGSDGATPYLSVNDSYVTPLGGSAFNGDALSVTNIPITGLQGSGGAGTPATNGIAGQSLLSSANGGVYWGNPTGDGAGLTNINQTNIVGSLWFTNPAAASSVSNAYNVTSSTNYVTKLSVGGASETTDAINATGNFRVSGDGLITGQLTIGQGQNFDMGGAKLYTATSFPGYVSLVGSTATADPRLYFGKSGSRAEGGFTAAYSTNVVLVTVSATTPQLKVMSATTNAADLLVSSSITATNGFIHYPQPFITNTTLSSIRVPVTVTNAASTNYLHYNYTGVGPIYEYCHTNYAATNSWTYRYLLPTVTDTAGP